MRRSDRIFATEFLIFFRLSGTRDFAAQPRPSECPESVRRSRGNLHHLGGFGGGKSDEIAKVYEVHRLSIYGLKSIEGLVEGDQIFMNLGCGDGDLVHIQPDQVAAVFDAALATGIFDEDPPHRFGGGCKKVTSTVPVLRLIHIDQSQVGLVNQSGRLECLSGVFPGHSRHGQLAEFVVDEG